MWRLEEEEEAKADYHLNPDFISSKIGKLGRFIQYGPFPDSFLLFSSFQQ